LHAYAVPDVVHIARAVTSGGDRHKLADINKVLEGLPNRNGGFTNFVVAP